MTSFAVAAIMLASGGTAVAMPRSAGDGWSVTPRQNDPDIPVTPVQPHVPPYNPPAAAPVTNPVWPPVSDSDIVLADGAQNVKQPHGLGKQVRAAKAPVNAAHSNATAGQAAAPASTVHLHVADQNTSNALGLDGVVLSVTGADDAGSVHIGLDYGGFAGAMGGGWSDRLRLFELPACALTTPDQPECRQETPIESSSNDDKAHQVGADVLFAPAAAPNNKARPNAGQGAQQTHVLAATAASSGSTGTPTAMPLSAAGSWSGGGSSGDFSYSYPFSAGNAPGGAAPNLALSYSSSSVDGLTSATNNQASWVGDGWDFTPGGYVERHYKSCAEDLGGNNGKKKTGDECWGVDNATLVLGGKSTELIKVNDTLWRPKTDDGSKVELLGGASNGSHDGQYWKVTTGDGTQYFLGLNHLPGWSAGKPETQSTWTVPVYGNNPGEDCYKANDFAGSSCQQAWRWNLDYIVDPHSNASAFYYKPETNYYGSNLNITTPGVSYVAGGYPLRVEYGLREVNGSVYGTGPTNQVTFDTAERCLPTQTFTCAPDQLTAANANHWPDVPFDQICTATKPCINGSPSFFSRERLTAVHSQYFSGGKPVDVDVWNLVQTFPGSGDASPPAMWLTSITHTGMGGGTPITLPPTTFGNYLFANRVDTVNDKYAPLTRNRIQEIRTETGGRITVAYSGQDCVAGTHMPASPDTDTMRCYASYWSPPSAKDPVLDWFHKYLATDVTEEDLTGGSAPVKTHYDYLGDAAWHYDNSQFTPDKDRTWNQWRGYQTVRTTIGEPNATQTVTEDVYMRGMDGDHLPKGTRPASVTDSDGGKITDQEALQGFTRESRTYLPNSTTVDSASINDPWVKGPTATSSDGVLKGYMVDVASVRGKTLLSDGKTYRRTQLNKKFNDSDQEIQQEDLGDAADPSDDTCTNTTYLTSSSGIFDRADEVSMFSGACTGTATADNSITDVKVSYDRQTFGAPPQKGDITEQDTLDSWDASGKHFVPTTKVEYDGYGREVKSTDVYGNVTKTAFTPETGGPVTGTTTTNPKGWTSTTTLDPARALPTSAVDVNGVHTDITYDALGRKTAVWNPGRSKANGDSPTAKFSYVESQTAPLSVETFSLQDNGSYTPSFTIYDGLGRTRETQLPAATGGRIIADTLYDSRGLQFKTNAPFYNSTSGPTGQLVGAADNTVVSQTVTQFDTRARATASILMSRGVEQWRTTTIYGGDRTTTIPPSGGSPSTVVTDAEGQTTQLLQYTDGYTAGGANPADVTKYAYNAAGAMTSMTDSSGNVWTTKYDLRGRKTQQNDPDTGTTRFGYDQGAQLTSTTDARGKTVVYSYDELGRKTQENADSSSGPKLASWTYDTLSHGLGLPSASTRWDGTNAYVNRVVSYDTFSRPTATAIDIPAKEGPLAGTYAFAMQYTPTGAVAQTTSPKAGNLPQENVFHTYSALGLPDTTYAIDSAGKITNLVSRSAYTDLNEMSLLQLDGDKSSANVGITQTYDQVTRRPENTQVTRATQTDSLLANRTYSYDPAGNVTKITNAPQDQQADTQCFGYDYLQRMTDAWTPSSADCTAPKSATTLGGPAPYWNSYTFDKSGNRKTQVQHQATGDVESKYSYPDAGATAVRPHALQKVDVAGPAGTSTSSYSYDEAGSMRTRDVGGNPQTFTYDQEGHTATESDASGNSSYVYDADGNRLITHDPHGNTLAIGDLELFNTAGTPGVTATRFYSHGGTQIAERNGSGLKWMLGDLHGTNDLSITQGTLQPTQRYTDPFGNNRGTVASTWPDQHGFVGGYQDTTGLTHLGARDYDPTAGRFITADPLLTQGAPQTWNAYAYGNNAPATASDPTGTTVCYNNDYCKSGAGPTYNYDNETGTLKLAGGSAKPTSSKSAAAGSAAYNQTLTKEGYDPAKLQQAHQVVKKSKIDVFYDAAGELFKSLIGWDDIKDCFHGSVWGCVKTIINLIPWGKVLKTGEIVEDFWKGARAFVTFGEDVERAEKVIADGDRILNDAEKAGEEAEHLAQESEQAGSEASHAAEDAKSSGESEGGVGSDEPKGCDNCREKATPDVVAQQGSTDAAGTVQVFRNVDATEFDSIAATGRFGTGEGQMEGKWFATQGEHADRWGELLNGGNGLTVTTRIPRSLADKLHFHAGKLDGVGPGYYADGDQLAQINQLMSGIELWP